MSSLQKDIYEVLLRIRTIGFEGQNKEDIQQHVDTFIQAIILGNLKSDGSFNVVEHDLIMTRDGSRMILDLIIDSFNSHIKKLRVTAKNQADLLKFREKYEWYVKTNASKEALLFYNRLDQEEYSIIDAAQILNLTRQTLSKYVKEGLHGFKLTANKKINKQQIYEYFDKKQPLFIY